MNRSKKKLLKFSELKENSEGQFNGGFTAAVTNGLIFIFGGEVANNCNGGNCISGCGKGQNIVAGCGKNTLMCY
jgi:hypothetical protein